MTNGIEATYDATAGAYRWDSNDRIVPPDVCDSCGISALPDFDRTRHGEAYRAETAAFIADYRRIMADVEPTDEERAEARAAHGPGVVLRNVITGRTWTT